MTYVLCGSMDKRENKTLSIISALRRSTANTRILKVEHNISVRELTKSFVHHFLCKVF